MNRKLLNGLLATAIIMGGAASVTSCKDTDEDQYAQLKSDNLSLGKKLKHSQLLRKNSRRLRPSASRIVKTLGRTSRRQVLRSGSMTMWLLKERLQLSQLSLKE